MRGDPDFDSKHLTLDPFAEPEPSQETGPGTHFRSTFANLTPEASPPPYEATDKSLPTQHTGSSTATNPFRRKPVSATTTGQSQRSSIPGTINDVGQLTPPMSSSPSKKHFLVPYRDDPAAEEVRTKKSAPAEGHGHSRSRSLSLNQRYPGDQSHRPLEILRRESQKARRAPHLHRRNQSGPDTIDRLDVAALYSYHHEGPYDAASLARNQNPKTSPLAALRYGNTEALRATPRENVMDSIQRHRPLDNVASIPSGGQDRFGRTYRYREGPNLQVEGGYRRWPGVDYLDEDLKGKGEPSYSIEKALKADKRARGEGAESIEMTSRPRNKSHSPVSSGVERDDMRRSNTTGKPTEGFRRRFGSLRRRREEQ